MLTDGRGVVIGLAIGGANVNDFKLLRETFESIPVTRPMPTPERLQHVCLDKGYDYEEVRRLLEQRGFTPHIRSRGEEAKLLRQSMRDGRRRYRARRWVVERTHSWMNRFRRILIRWEKKDENYAAMLFTASALIAVRAGNGLCG